MKTLQNKRVLNALAEPKLLQFFSARCAAGEAISQVNLEGGKGNI